MGRDDTNTIKRKKKNKKHEKQILSHIDASDTFIEHNANHLASTTCYKLGIRRYEQNSAKNTINRHINSVVWC